nr:protein DETOXIFICATION 16-like isoform X2 [Lolium perenne]
MHSSTRFLNNQGAVLPLMLSSLLCSVLNVPLCWLLVLKSPLANKGADMALPISYWFNTILLALYIKYSPTCKETWTGFLRDAFHHVPQFLKLAVSSALMICLRFWALELLVFLSAILPDPKLETSAFSITRNTSSIVTMISVGLSTSASIRVSNELGAGHPKQARKVVLIALFIATSEGLSVPSLLVLLRNVWGKVYSNETKVVKYVANM